MIAAGTGSGASLTKRRIERGRKPSFERLPPSDMGGTPMPRGTGVPPVD